MSARKVVATIAALDQATKRGEQLASSLAGDLEHIAQGSATASSQKLFGVVGASLGAASAIGLAVLSGISAPLLAPVFLALGGAAGVLFWRGRRGIRFEKEMHYRVAMLDIIKTQIGELPPGTPKSVKDELWSEYQAVMRGYTTASIAALAPTKPVHSLPAAKLPVNGEEDSSGHKAKSPSWR